MNNQKCNCHSYNLDDPESGKDPQVVLSPDSFFDWTTPKGDVCVDHCIAYTIRHLWATKIWTRASCCGHNKFAPSIIFDENLSEDGSANIRKVIAEVDSREFEILSWKLCKL